MTGEPGRRLDGGLALRFRPQILTGWRVSFCVAKALRRGGVKSVKTGQKRPGFVSYLWLGMEGRVWAIRLRRIPPLRQKRAKTGSGGTPAPRWAPSVLGGLRKCRPSGELPGPQGRGTGATVILVGSAIGIGASRLCAIYMHSLFDMYILSCYRFGMSNHTDSTQPQLPDLGPIEYDPRQFRNIHETEFGQAIWHFLLRRDNVIRMQTATYLDRAAVEPLADGLLAEFGVGVAEDRVKQYIGHAVRQIMEACGYHLDRQGMRITRDNLFTSASRYRSNAERAMFISADSRKKWMEKTANSPFNRWLDPQIKNPDGTLSLDKLYEVARRWHIEERYEHLNAGQIRMNIGVRLRKAVPVAEYTPGPQELKTVAD